MNTKRHLELQWQDAHMDVELLRDRLANLDPRDVAFFDAHDELTMAEYELEQLERDLLTYSSIFA